MITDVPRYLKVRGELRTLERKLSSADPSGSRAPVNVSDLILTWNAFNPRIAADDRTLLQDYVHFLLVRDELERFISAATPLTRAYLESLVAPKDLAFRQQTRPIDPGLAGLFPRASSAWWWRVTPRRRELRRQFAEPTG